MEQMVIETTYPKRSGTVHYRSLVGNFHEIHTNAIWAQFIGLAPETDLSDEEKAELVSENHDLLYFIRNQYNQLERINRLDNLRDNFELHCFDAHILNPKKPKTIHTDVQPPSVYKKDIYYFQKAWRLTGPKLYEQSDFFGSALTYGGDLYSKELKTEFPTHRKFFLELADLAWMGNERSKAWLIRLLFQFLQEPNLKIEEEVQITALNHRVIVDHVIYRDDKPIVFCEDKAFDIEMGITQNFDQMRTYSLSQQWVTDGRPQPLFGIVSNLHAWVFTCYVIPPNPVPLPNSNLSSKNFYTTNRFQFGIDGFTVNALVMMLKFYIDKRFLEVFKHFHQ